MNHNAKKLVEALRSGDYKQGVMFLQQKREGLEQLCCLGVACVLYKLAGSPYGALGEHRVSMDSLLRERVVYTTKDGTTVSVVLPEPVREWLNFKESDGSFKASTGVYTGLTILNDKGVPFSEIADIIEGEPEDLFRPDVNAKAVEDLEKIYARIGEPEHWTQNAFARNAKYAFCTCLSEEAVSWCVAGAMIKEGVGINRDARLFLTKYLGPRIDEFNDSHTHAEVLAAVREAILAARRGDPVPSREKA